MAAILAFDNALSPADGAPSTNSKVLGELACTVTGIKDDAEIAVTPELSVGSRSVSLACTFRNFKTQNEEKYFGTLQTVANNDQKPTPQTLLWIVKTNEVAAVKPGALSQRFEVDGSQGDEKSVAVKGETKGNISLVLLIEALSRRQSPPPVVSLKLELASATT
jgi:hypothetical protein